MPRWHIKSIEALPNLRLQVLFVDGLEGIIDLHPDELTGVLEPLKGERDFGRVELVDGVAT